MAAHRAALLPNARAAGAGGKESVEGALVILLFLALMLLVFEGGLLTANWFALGNAAREGAHTGSLAVATDAQVLETVNRTASIFTGGFASVTANTAQSGCTGTDAVCTCRHRVGSTTCNATAARDDLIDVTVRHRFMLLPYAGGFVGQNAGIQLTAFEQARVE
jgi:Flp pilus assembly protein TadG